MARRNTRRSKRSRTVTGARTTATTMKMVPLTTPTRTAVVTASLVLSSMMMMLRSSVVVDAQQVTDTNPTDREILEKLFDNAGGKNWIHQHKWKETDNVCNWYGIVCDDENFDGQDDDYYDSYYDDDGAAGDDDYYAVPTDTTDDDAVDNFDNGGNRRLSERELERLVTEQRRSTRDAKQQRNKNRRRRLQTNRDHPGRRDDDGRRIQDDDDDIAPTLDDDNTNDDGGGYTPQSGVIKAIRLGGNNLNGTLISEIFNIESLAELDVKDNPDLKVNLNGIGKLTELQTLYLSDVNMEKSDLQGLGEATALRELHLTNNGFTGEVPDEIFKLKLLDALFIAFNDFEGSFPTGLYNTNLTELWAYDNLFSGNLPQDIDQGLPNLRRLVLGGNAWSGTIPESFMKLRQMRHFSIRNLRDTMELAGPGLSGDLPSFHGQKYIKALHLNHNNLTGTIPTGLLKNVEDKDRTLSVNLTHNMLTGVVPYELIRFKRLELDVTANRLTGFAPGLCNDDGSYANDNMTNWQDGRVLDFGCDAILCPADSASVAGRAASDDVMCTPCELPDGFKDWDDDDGFDDDDDLYYDDAPGDGGNNRRTLRRLRGLQNNDVNGTTPAFIPDTTPFWGKLQCEYLDESGTTVDKTGDEVADLDGYGDERSILIQLYQALGGDSWDYKDHWLDDTKGICVWYGITCRIVDGQDAGDNAVERINLDGNNLVGDVPSIIYNLPDLKEISLMRNDITITFQNIANATELENLFLEGIRLSDLSGVEQAKGLKKLIVSDNGLSGPFPTNLYQLERLTELMLDDNELTGPLPSDISVWTKMTRFDVTRNQLTGQLPSFDTWEDLRVLDLSNNLWSGYLPSGLANMKKLEVLAIYGSDSTPGIGGPLLDFADCPELMEIYLEDNSFTGTISHQFLASNDHTNRTIYVALSRNQLNGTLPAELSKFDRLTITLDDNAISGIPDVLCNETSWMEGEVKEFGCDAILCPPGTYHTEIGRATKLLGDCMTCDSLQSDPSLGNTFCGDDSTSGGETGTETAGSDDANEREILTNFFTATGGPQWNMKDNWLNDNVSICQWYGVTCGADDDGSAGHVMRLELMDNALVGSVTSDMYQLEYLKEIDFDKNPGLKVHFEGAGSSKLERFRMSGTQVDLTGIDEAKYLSYIDCADAGLTGPLPDALLNMPQLISLELTANALTGHIHHHIERWTNMMDLYLDHNMFTGTLTTHIGKLTNLKELALSHNAIVGPLPSELNKLTKLELFGAKEQKDADGSRTLNGTLPSFHASPNLNEIYLSENILSGNIPDDLLQSSNARTSDSYIVYLGLDANRFTGTLPESLDGIQNLILDINDNYIEAVPDTFCDADNAQWQNGGVAKYGCDAILCPKGHYLSPTGRQVQPDKPCEKCDVVGGASFMGSTSCLSLSEVVGRPILKEIYEQLGGDDWYNNENWLQEHKEVCEWYGVNCNADKTIQSLKLNSNNLRGTMPEDVWQIPGLQTLWLYSNPLLDITFQKVHKANKLQTLLIDSTLVSNIDGLEQASDTLEEIDLRFNYLQGEFPYRQIAELTNLKVLSIANNQLSGKLNSYGLGEKTKLQKLRLGGNRFDGELPDFSTFPALQQLDLSDNFFAGTIPSVFLKDVKDTSAPITIDLASNKLDGTVPSEPFERFDQLTLYLRGNMFNSINQQLCAKQNWNGGDVGLYGCDGLMCPPHTFAPTGRQRSAEEPCQSCDRPTAFFAGAYECEMHATEYRSESSSSANHKRTGFILTIVSFIAMTCVAGFIM